MQAIAIVRGRAAMRPRRAAEGGRKSSPRSVIPLILALCHSELCPTNRRLGASLPLAAAMLVPSAMPIAARTYDVAVVGGGPAGLTAAITLAAAAVSTA